MIAAQLLLLELCVRLSAGSTQVTTARPNLPLTLSNVFTGRTFSQLKSGGLNQFWGWRHFELYLLVFALALGQLAMGGQAWYVELIGMMALLLESTMAFPQIYRNYQRGSTEGLRYDICGILSRLKLYLQSLFLIMTWFGGDAFKTWYFVTNNAPFQFLVCGIVQLCADFVVLLQLIILKQ
jgi:hypothetical protein